MCSCLQTEEKCTEEGEGMKKQLSDRISYYL